MQWNCSDPERLVYSLLLYLVSLSLLRTDDLLEFRVAVYGLPSCFASWTASFCLLVFRLASQVLSSLTCRPYVSSLDLCIQISPRVSSGFAFYTPYCTTPHHCPPFSTRHLAIIVNT